MSDALLSSTLTTSRSWTDDEPVSVTSGSHDDRQVIDEFNRSLDALRSHRFIKWRPKNRLRSDAASNLVLVDVVFNGPAADMRFSQVASIMAQQPALVDYVSTGPADVTFSSQLGSIVAQPVALVDAGLTAGTLESSRPAWWHGAEAKFTALRGLPANWNGYGAPTIDGGTIDRAANLLGSLVDPGTPEPSIVPAAKGGVQAEWHTMIGDLEIELQPDGSVSALFTDARDGSEIEPAEVSFEILRALVLKVGE